MVSAPGQVEYTDALGQQIGLAVIEGKSLHKISMGHGMPHIADLLAWVVDDDHPFSVVYRSSLDMWCHILHHECLALADKCFDAETAAAARLKIQVRRDIIKAFAPSINRKESERVKEPAIQVVLGSPGDPYKEYADEKQRQIDGRFGASGSEYGESGASGSGSELGVEPGFERFGWGASKRGVESS